jgi:hypothetical protein
MTTLNEWALAEFTKRLAGIRKLADTVEAEGRGATHDELDGAIGELGVYNWELGHLVAESYGGATVPAKEIRDAADAVEERQRNGW